MNLTALIPPPHLIQRRAWDCAYMLVSEYLARLDQGTLEWCAWRAARQPASLEWDEIGVLFRLYRGVVGARV